MEGAALRGDRSGEAVRGRTPHDLWAAGPTRAARLAPYVADHEGVTSPLTRLVAEAERHTLVKAAGGRAW